MPGDQSDDPGVCNPAFAKENNDDEEDDDGGEDGDDDTLYLRRGKKTRRKKDINEGEVSDDSGSSQVTVNDSPASSPRIPGFR